MDTPVDTDDRSRLGRVALAITLAVAAVSSLRRGKRLRGVLATAGALGVGYTVVSGTDKPTVAVEETTTGIGDETTTTAETGAATGTGAAREDDGLRCAACGEPIRPGQRRGPNADDETVHEACLEA